MEDAEHHSSTGLNWARRPEVHFWLDEGRCLQGLADVAEARGEHSRAMEYLDGAAAKFAEYGAKLYLDRGPPRSWCSARSADRGGFDDGDAPRWDCDR